MFTVSSDDAGAFFQAIFNGQGSLAVVSVGRVNGGGDDPPFSVDAIVTTDEHYGS
jgi:hypothetical protein